MSNETVDHVQAWVGTMIRANRVERMNNSPQLTLGEMIQRLEAIPLTYETHDGKMQPKHVWFEFANTYPEGVQSWRGSYAELAITFDYNGRLGGRPRPDVHRDITGAEFLMMLKGAVGQTFMGYKGGDFTMGDDTPVWVANYGDSGNTGVVGIKNTEWAIYIETAWCEF